MSGSLLGLDRHADLMLNFHDNVYSLLQVEVLLSIKSSLDRCDCPTV